MLISLLTYFLSNSISFANTSSNGLTNLHKTQLKSLGIRIAVPTYIPDGFKFFKITVEKCSPSEKPNSNGVCRFNPSYEILYRNKEKKCFSVDAIGGGLGGPGFEFSYPVTTKLLGKVDMVFGRRTRGKFDPRIPTFQELSLPQSGSIFTFWASTSGGLKGPFYSIQANTNRSSECSAPNSITPLEVEKILKSLVLLD